LNQAPFGKHPGGAFFVAPVAPDHPDGASAAFNRKARRARKNFSGAATVEVDAPARKTGMSDIVALGSQALPLTDSPALQRILRVYAPMCHRLASSHEANPDRARDLAQDILVAVWRAGPAFRKQCSERTYVARIAQYRIATHVGRAVREPRLAPLSDDLVAGEPTPEDHAIRSDERAFLTAHVRQLPIALREVAVLLLEGFSPAEIADTLGLTPNAVSIRGLRARELLRVSLENGDER
jgi:RNA polymerase sigma-70 factor (ECF subfamily)